MWKPCGSKPSPIFLLLVISKRRAANNTKNLLLFHCANMSRRHAPACAVSHRLATFALNLFLKITMKKQIPLEESKKTLEMLCERFPNTFFNSDHKESVKPLKNGIRHEILALYPEYFDKYALRVALGFYCSRKHYLKSVLTHTIRVDLEGNLCGEITEENRETALKVLDAFDKRFKTAKTTKKTKTKKSEQAVKVLEKIEPTNPIEEVHETEIVTRPKLTLKRKTSPEK